MDTERRGQQRSTPRPGIMDGGTWTPKALRPSAELSGRRGKVEERGLCLGPPRRGQGPAGGRPGVGSTGVHLWVNSLAAVEWAAHPGSPSDMASHE